MVRRLLLLAVASVVVSVVVYLALVCTPVGQQLGDDILADRLRLDRRLRVSTQTALMLLTARSLLVLALGVAVVPLVQRRWRLALGVVVVVLGTAVIVEVLKAVLPRPDFGIDPPSESANSLPSGHASIGVALALALVMVVPVGWRRWAGALGGAGAAFIAAGVIVAGWHRPSDVMSGVLLAVAVAAVVSAALLWWRSGTPESGVHELGAAGSGRWWVAGVVAVVAPLVAAPVLVTVVPGGPDVWRAGVDVAVGVAVAVVAAVLAVGLFARTLVGTALDPVSPLPARC